MAAIPKNNAFGYHSPSWNLPFPNGNLTAAEILAYLPHWLKSIDVIDRFVTHGAKAGHLAAMINEYRDQPLDQDFPPNSAMIMIQYAMRRAGYDDWKFGMHLEYNIGIPRPEDNLNVHGFRTPNRTHPKDVRTGTPGQDKVNWDSSPLEFKDLALHVKEHPCGDDALDLTRCVQYAIEHEEESWLFPTDFPRLITHLGGPATVTHNHYDKQVFARHSNYAFSPAKSTPGKGRAPRTPKTPTSSKLNNKVKASRGSKKKLFDDIELVAMSRSATPQKRTVEGLGKVLDGSKRRSGRLVGKQMNFAEEPEVDTEDKDYFDSPYATPSKKRKLSRLPPTPNSSADDDEFVEDESEPDDDILEEDTSEPEEAISPIHAARGRKAARKARLNIKAAFVPERRTLKLKVPGIGPSPQKVRQQTKVPSYMMTEFTPDVMDAAREYLKREPVFFPAPFLSEDRLRIDNYSIYLYSSPPHTSFPEMYASAYDYARFNGPRRHAPFRELHLLSQPHPKDTSDWAENIRWAKQQFNLFGSVWTEYDWHLECITAHRYEIGWVSEEVVRDGM
ncbi:hypothetical protein J4E93_003686 [Alternaria ventricosa]|uniref:uncharacterized protein n=1 Tax=Alternaria ventricosa TaxID=1187951 RepID=UPI0020C1F2E6|nr:uncharacterized protein J4E93_003686 [Alternaria ventricosa]KAI4649369.1 hypothetical protein J4E93_003686 [Alternaria ventricosa]